MSRRVSRLLVWLYPPRWRRRYGDELLTLADELARSGRRSRAGLVVGLLTGAAGQWWRQARWQISGGVAVVTIALVALALAFSGGSSSRAPVVGIIHLPVTAAHERGPASCFVGSTACGGPVCAEPIGVSASTSHSPATVRQATAVPKCSSLPRVRPRPVFVSAG